ncbi:Arabinose operon regulatory protein [compost metagenome]
MRIQRAKMLISQNIEMPLREIAELTGFGDQRYFSKVFKGLTGFSPSEFRKGTID